MDMAHSRARRLHGLQGLLVDVRRFNRIDLLFQLGDLRRRLFEILLMKLFPSESSLGGWSAVALAGVIIHPRNQNKGSPCVPIPYHFYLS